MRQSVSSEAMIFYALSVELQFIELSYRVSKSLTSNFQPFHYGGFQFQLRVDWFLVWKEYSLTETALKMLMIIISDKMLFLNNAKT